MAFSRQDIRPGETVRAVIVPPHPPMLSAWAEVDAGAELPMYEGARLCGVGRVLWRRDADWPLSQTDEDRFLAWIQGSDKGPIPAERPDRRP
jgi:hypothetical protein